MHPPYATAIAANHEELPLITNHAKGYLKHVPTIDIASSGSDKLANYVIEEYKNHEIVAILMKRAWYYICWRKLQQKLSI